MATEPRSLFADGSDIRAEGRSARVGDAPTAVGRMAAAVGGEAASPPRDATGEPVPAAESSASAASRPPPWRAGPEDPSGAAPGAVSAAAGSPAGAGAPPPGLAPPLSRWAVGASRPAGGSWFGTVMLVVALVALLLSGMLWQRLDHIQQELAKRSASVAQESEQSLEAAQEARAQVQELQARLTLAEVKLSEVTLQRTQLEELMLSVSRSRDDTLVLDIESGIRLAMQQAELTGSAQPLVAALQAAMRRIDKAAQPRLNPVQRAMARDLEKIKSSAVADLPMLAARLDELARSVDGWWLVNDVGREAAREGARPRGGHAASGAGTQQPRVEGGPATAAEAEGGAQAPAAAAVAPPASGKKTIPAHAQRADPAIESIAPAAGASAAGLWRRWGEPVWHSVRDLVRVSRIDEPEAVLLAPQQAVFLRENLKLRLLNVRLSLLSRQITAARADMQFVRAALQKYFDLSHPATRQALQTLEEALAASRSLELPRPEDTLAALATAAGGR